MGQVFRIFALMVTFCGVNYVAVAQTSNNQSVEDFIVNGNELNLRCQSFSNVMDRWACSAGQFVSPNVLPPQIFGGRAEYYASADFRERYNKYSKLFYATRLFIKSEEFPPTAFNGYGMLVITTKPDSSEIGRFINICKAFLQVLESEHTFKAPAEMQMVTTWPLIDAELADNLNITTGWLAVNNIEDKCKSALENYDFTEAAQVAKDARMTGFVEDGPGPYLIAWSPSSKKGESDAVVLTANLSNVSDLATAKNYLGRWEVDIENNQELFEEGFNFAKLKKKIAEMLDKHGVLFEVFWNNG